MAAPEALVSAFLAYAKLDEETAQADAAVIDMVVEAAVGYLRDAGVEEPEESDTLDTSRYRLCVSAYALYLYDHRDAVSGEASFPIGLRPVLNQLKLTQQARAVAQEALAALDEVSP